MAKHLFIGGEKDGKWLETNEEMVYPGEETTIDRPNYGNYKRLHLDALGDFVIYAKASMGAADILNALINNYNPVTPTCQMMDDPPPPIRHVIPMSSGIAQDASESTQGGQDES